MDEDVPKTVSFVVSDVETAAGNLEVQAESSNTELLLDSGLQITGAGTNRTLTITTITNAYGSATISIMVTDTDGATTSTSFDLTVNSVNDAPTLTAIPNQSINEDGSVGPLNFTVDDPDPETLPEDLIVTASSSMLALVPSANLAFGGFGSARTISLTPAQNQFGTATITVTVDDGTTNSSRVFTVSVNAVNDQPTLNPLPDLVLDEGAGQQTVNLSGISTGATNEIQTLTITSISSNPGLIPNPILTY